MKQLQNKVIVITGAARGLGKALAGKFHKEGCHLALIDVDPKGLENLKQELQKQEPQKNNQQTTNPRITIHHADVASEQEIKSTRKSIIEQHGHIDMLINNAGVSISRPFEQVDLEDFKNLFEINFWGAVYCTKHFLPDLKRQRESALVNIISSFALMGFPGKTCYASSKSALMGFSHSLRTEVCDSGVKVSLVIPPPLDTSLIWSGKHIDEEKRRKEASFLKAKGMPIDKAAEKIVHGIRKSKFRIVIGPMMFWTDLAMRLLPTFFHNQLAKRKKRFDFM